ncbi:MAG TPA: HAMP domain-containing sensor histidine kinase [Lachnospiraceae bacterium]|nr:HAMP domain-containing sensor histidine kinase [Lachnospiraceae bacterium]
MKETKEKEEVRFYNRISFRVYLYFAIIISVFAATLGMIFMNLNETNVKKTYKDRLLSKGLAIAENLNNYIEYENYDEYRYFITTLNKIESTDMDIWILSNGNPDSPMNELADTDLSNMQMNKGVEYVLNSALEGEIKDRTYYSDVYNEVEISIGVPVYDEKNNVVGAVLLHSPIKGQTQLAKQSLRMILISACMALLVSFIIAVVFAKRLSRPISKMRKTAMELAEGDYSQKTGIDQNDELGYLAQTFDVLSERLAQGEEERRNLEQMRLDFFANVSHELRTPITVIRAYTEMLIDGVVTNPEKINANYNRMLLECKSMERLVGDLLTLSKMQNPDFAVEKEPINLVQIFDDIVRNAHAICSKKHIQLQISKDNDKVMMLGDYDRLRQMFMVIFDNAVKFSNENTTIYINLISMDIIRISIKDEGVGISEEELPYIFEKFYKSKLRQNATGSGLGLAIAKQIALKHNGKIEVYSKSGMGSEFVFVFPKMENVNECEEHEDVLQGA